MAKRVGGRGFAPDPAGGAYDAPLDPLVGWGGDAFAATNFAPSALNFGVPIVVNLRNDHWSKVELCENYISQSRAQHLKHVQGH